MNKLDLKGVKCPMNFVKAKLTLEKMSRGDILQITLDKGETYDSVIKSLTTEGYLIHSQDRQTATIIVEASGE
jgi:sulfite reductase (ferredoxin)